MCVFDVLVSVAVNETVHSFSICTAVILWPDITEHEMIFIKENADVRHSTKQVQLFQCFLAWMPSELTQ